jgi:hypothetical protein
VAEGVAPAGVEVACLQHMLREDGQLVHGNRVLGEKW